MSPLDQISTVEGLIGSTLEIEASTPVYRHTVESVSHIQAPAIWQSLGLTGENMRIGVIDSGIDYHHTMFGGNGLVAYESNDPTIIEPGTFPTAKVVGGYDFAGDDFDGWTPNPDPDPIDPASNSHGTSVAGIIAGRGVDLDGNTYIGSYDAPHDSK